MAAGRQLRPLALLAAGVVLAWVAASSGFLVSFAVPLVACLLAGGWGRPWALAVALLATPPGLASPHMVVRAVVSYAHGSAAFWEPAGFGAVDPETRLPNRTRAHLIGVPPDEQRLWRPLRRALHDGTLRVLVRAFGAPASAYDGPLPDRAQTADRFRDGAVPLRLEALAEGALIGPLDGPIAQVSPEVADAIRRASSGSTASILAIAISPEVVLTRTCPRTGPAVDLVIDVAGDRVLAGYLSEPCGR